MELKTIAIIAAVVVVALLVVFRKQLKNSLSALVNDYVFDALFSFADNFVGGFAGLDVGDWIGATIIFFRERKASGMAAALVVAWEAANFIPLSFIPVAGEGLEVVTNIIPSSFIARIVLHKFSSAVEEEKVLEQNVRVAGEEGIPVIQYKAEVEKIKKLLKENDPVEALKEGRKADKEISTKIRKRLDKVISAVDGEIQSILQQDPRAEEEVMAVLQQGMDGAKSLLQNALDLEKKKEYEEAFKAVRQAHAVLSTAVERFNQMCS